jgi:hypothetical protein
VQRKNEKERSAEDERPAFFAKRKAGVIGEYQEK